MTDDHTILVVDTSALERIAITRQELLKLPDVCRVTKLSESAIYEKMAEGTFPIPVQLTARAVAWPAAEVLDWMAALPRTVIRQAAVKRRAAAQ